MSEVKIEAEVEQDNVCLSRIFLCEQIGNKARKKAANAFYYPAFLVDSESADLTPCLFTENDLVKAAKRAASNPEDIESLDFKFMTQEDRDAIGREYIDATFQAITWSLLFTILWNKLMGRQVPLDFNVGDTDGPEEEKGSG